MEDSAPGPLSTANLILRMRLGAETGYRGTDHVKGIHSNLWMEFVKQQSDVPEKKKKKCNFPDWKFEFFWNPGAVGRCHPHSEGVGKDFIIYAL